jgi:hypothetical protein
VHNREGWKKLLRRARNRHILHMPMEWMNEWMTMDTPHLMQQICSRRSAASHNWVYCSTRWRWVVKFMPWPLYPMKEPQYSSNRRLGGPHSQSWHFGEGNNLLLLHRGKPKYTEKNLSQCHFICHRSHTTALGLKLRVYGDSPATNCLSHGKTW